MIQIHGGSKAMKKLFVLIMMFALAAFAAACDRDGGSGDEDADGLEDVIPEVEDDGVEVPPDMPGDTVPDPDDDGEADVTDDVVEPGLPGSACVCDSHCQDVDGQEGICVFGVCMVQASAACSAAGSTAECPEHMGCWGLVGYDGSAICWPYCDTFDCVGACDTDDVCVPTSGMDCDASCGTYCGGGSGDSPIGGACETDADCADADAFCYPDYYDGEHTGFAEGYCLIFGCPTEGEDCGTGGICVAGLTSGGDNVCMGVCGTGCRAGYECNDGYCWPGCTSTTDCPDGYTCAGGICMGEGCIPCSPEIPLGRCDAGGWCDAGTCNTTDPYECIATDSLEPNNSRTEARALAAGLTADLSITGGDEDWFAVSVPAGHITQVTLTHNLSVGDLDMVAYEPDGTLLGSRYWNFSAPTYPYTYRDWETWTETLSFYNEAGEDDTYHLRILAHSGESNYTMEVENIPWTDDLLCTDHYTSAQCQDYANLIMFPFADPDDSFLGDDFVLQITSNYRFLRREALMLLRYALAEVNLLYPGNDLGVWDLTDMNAVTPGFDVCDPRHDPTTHDQGGFGMDVAYYQEGETHSYVGNICGPGETNHDGYWCTSAAETGHLVDLERQAYFQVALARHPRLRVAGYDRVIGPLVQAEINRLQGDGIVTAAEASAAISTMTWGDGWPFHYHHVHISMEWIY
jgi:hypothetical protein